MVSRVEIIAEAGVNHNGDPVNAKKLVDIAAFAGADTVKFQTFTTENFVSGISRKAEYQQGQGLDDEGQYDMLRRLEFGSNQWRELRDYCQRMNLCFLSTAFDTASLKFLVELGQSRFKIPSGEINNLPYLRSIGKYGYPVLLSTGMSTMMEIGQAIDILEEVGTSREKITALQCTTEYPSRVDEANLRAMNTIGETFGVAVGYSDHTPGIEIPIAAVALGAKVIEKHFTIDRRLPGPDHSMSLESTELKGMVAAIRNVESAMGDGKKKPTASELKNIDVVRKSIFTCCSIRRGEVFSEHNICTKRPGTGISPMRWDEVIGSIAPREFADDELVEL